MCQESACAPDSTISPPSTTTTTRYCVNAALNACGRAGRVKEALELMKDARASGIELDVVSYNSAIPACVESGDWEQALSMIREMENEHEIKPNHITYQAAIKVSCVSRVVDCPTSAQRGGGGGGGIGGKTEKERRTE